MPDADGDLHAHEGAPHRSCGRLPTELATDVVMPATAATPRPSRWMASSSSTIRPISPDRDAPTVDGRPLCRCRDKYATQVFAEIRPMGTGSPTSRTSRGGSRLRPPLPALSGLADLPTGGFYPLWSRNGRELFFIDEAGCCGCPCSGTEFIYRMPVVVFRPALRRSRSN